MYSSKRVEKRRFQRLGVNLSALYEIEGPQHVKDILSERDEFEGIIVDLSEGGLAMVVGHYLPPGTKLHIKFIVYEYDTLGIVNFYTPLKICGFVRHVTSDIDDEFRLGISFCGINEDKQDTLEDFLYLSLCPPGYHSDF